MIGFCRSYLRPVFHNRMRLPDSGNPFCEEGLAGGTPDSPRLPEIPPRLISRRTGGRTPPPTESSPTP